MASGGSFSCFGRTAEGGFASGRAEIHLIGSFAFRKRLSLGTADENRYISGNFVRIQPVRLLFVQVLPGTNGSGMKELLLLLDFHIMQPEITVEPDI